jgi:DNA-binding NtrC family response regulator
MSATQSEPGRHLVVLYVDDEPHNLQLFELLFAETFDVRLAASGADALDVLARENVGVVLTDERMPGMAGIELLARVAERFPEVVRVIVSAYSDSDRVMRAINQGRAHEYILKPWDRDELGTCIERCLAMARRRRDLASRAAVGEALTRELQEEYARDRIVGDVDGLRPTVAAALRAARSDATVLLVGETGTGKELIAQLVHSNSPRSQGPFIRLNCAALAEGVLESELFGHEQGAFTSAHRLRRGRFELADGGTIFLDEIGDISPRVQVALLRVLQEREFERIGGSATIRVDTRVIAATHRDIPRLVREDRFREDLYYRLNVVVIQVPPLRERPQDVLPLARHFIAKHCPSERPRPSISPLLAERLVSYSWPGNVRELENLIQRALIMSHEPELVLEDFCFTLAVREEAEDAGNTFISRLRRSEDDAEAEKMRQLFIKHAGNITRAAREAAVPRTTFISRAKKYGLM